MNGTNTIRDSPPLALQLLDGIIDSFEKLDIALFLYSVRSASRSVLAISDAVFLSPRRTRDAIAALSLAGVIRAHGGGWWFDPNSNWGPGVEALARMYETSRAEVLELVTARLLATARQSSTGR